MRRRQPCEELRLGCKYKGSEAGTCSTCSRTEGRPLFVEHILQGEYGDEAGDVSKDQGSAGLCRPE